MLNKVMREGERRRAGPDRAALAAFEAKRGVVLGGSGLRFEISGDEEDETEAEGEGKGEGVEHSEFGGVAIGGDEGEGERKEDSENEGGVSVLAFHRRPKKTKPSCR